MKRLTVKCPHCDEQIPIKKHNPERNFNEVMFHMFITHNDVYNKAMGIEA